MKKANSSFIATVAATVLGLGALACGTQTTVCRQCGLSPNRSYVLLFDSGATQGRTADANGCVSYSCLSAPRQILDPVTGQTFQVQPPQN